MSDKNVTKQNRTSSFYGKLTRNSVLQQITSIYKEKVIRIKEKNSMTRIRTERDSVCCRQGCHKNREKSPTGKNKSFRGETKKFHLSLFLVKDKI